MISQHKVVVSIIESLFILLVALFAGLTGSLAAPGGNGVDNLRGQWEFTVSGLNDQPLDLKVFINDLGPDPNNRENFYVAAGCLQTASSNSTAPLSMQAIDQGSGRYALTMLGTVVPASQGQPFVVKFIGTAITDNRGVNNDEASGTVNTSFAKGNWSATHHDRRRTHCPAVEIPPLQFSGDVEAFHNYDGNVLTQVKTLFGGRTNIVSSSMLVKRPDGTTVVVPFFTDIFTPEVDFITVFNYLTPFNEGDDSDPMSGKTYTFTLLDALGNPIPGATKTDVWAACREAPPRNLRATVTPNKDINLTWDSVQPVPGFNPASGIGFYQITIDPVPWTPPGAVYGAHFIKSPSHLIPWNTFVPNAPGVPDGSDVGVALKSLADGSYRIWASSNSVPAPSDPGTGYECVVTDFGATVQFVKNGSSIIPY